MGVVGGSIYLLTLTFILQKIWTPLVICSS